MLAKAVKVLYYMGFEPASPVGETNQLLFTWGDNALKYQTVISDSTTRQPADVLPDTKLYISQWKCREIT